MAIVCASAADGKLFYVCNCTAVRLALSTLWQGGEVPSRALHVETRVDLAPGRLSPAAALRAFVAAAHGCLIGCPARPAVRGLAHLAPLVRERVDGGGGPLASRTRACGARRAAVGVIGRCAAGRSGLHLLAAVAL